MIQKTLSITAALALCLGVAHMVFGVMVYKIFGLEMLWFLGAGIAMMVTALANFRRDKIWVLGLQNLLMFGFISALAIAAPLPQIWFGVVLFGALLAGSFAKTPVSQ